MGTTRLVLDGHDLLDAPRTRLVERMLGWWASPDGPDLALPAGEVVVEVTDGARLGPPHVGPGTDAIGCFVVARDDVGLNDRWEVAVAYGGDFADGHDVAAWLATVPHELKHLSAFAERHNGQLPDELGFTRLARTEGGRDEGREEGVEAWARTVVDGFRRSTAVELGRGALLEGADRRLERNRDGRIP